MASKGGPFIAAGLCLVPLAIFGLAAVLLLFAAMFAMGNDTSDINIADTGSTGELSSVVPPNFATLFKEAATFYHLSPAIVAAIYLTEHHTDSFGADISLNEVQSNCDVSSAGALGPMQLMPSNWQIWVQNEASKFDIKNPNPCRYRDSILAGARYINREIFVYNWTGCKITTDKYVIWTSSCIMNVGEHYCGACTGPACGTNGYDYCQQTLRHYRLVEGSAAYLRPPLLIADAGGFTKCTSTKN